MMENISLISHIEKADTKPWTMMLIFSMVFHLLVLGLIIWLSGSFSGSRRPVSGTVYQVDLVEWPGANGPKIAAAVPGDKNLEARLRPDQPIKRINEAKAPEEASLKITKLKPDLKTEPNRKEETNSSELIKETISKIEKEAQAAKKAKEEEQGQIDQAISGLRTKVKLSESSTATQAVSGVTVALGNKPGSGGGLAMQLYQAEVENWIKSKWSYPAAMGKQKGLEAVVVLLVRANGAIEKTVFGKRSANALFDASVLRAVERANPLPPFPEGYRQTYEEFEINFNLKDLR